MSDNTVILERGKQIDDYFMRQVLNAIDDAESMVSSENKPDNFLDQRASEVRKRLQKYDQEFWQVLVVQKGNSKVPSYRKIFTANKQKYMVIERQKEVYIMWFTHLQNNQQPLTMYV